MGNVEATEAEGIAGKEAGVRVGGRDFVVRPLTFRQRLKLYELLAEGFAALLPADQRVMADAGGDPVRALPNLVRVVGPRLGELFQLVLGMDADWLDAHLDVTAEADLIEAILEVNDLPLLFSRLTEAGRKFGSRFRRAGASQDGSDGSQGSSPNR